MGLGPALALLLGLLLALLLFGQLNLVLEHTQLLAQLLGHMVLRYRLDLGLEVLGHVVDAEAAMVELGASVGLVLFLDVLEGSGNGFGYGVDVIALGHEATIVGGVVHAVKLAIVTGVLVVALGMGAAGVVELGLFFAIDAVLSQVTVGKEEKESFIII